MKISSIISVVGSILAVAFGFVNLSWVFLVNATVWDCVSFAIVSLILALVGALPGLAIGLMFAPQDAAPAVPTQSTDDSPPSAQS